MFDAIRMLLPMAISIVPFLLLLLLLSIQNFVVPIGWYSSVDFRTCVSPYTCPCLSPLDLVALDSITCLEFHILPSLVPLVLTLVRCTRPSCLDPTCASLSGLTECTSVLENGAMSS